MVGAAAAVAGVEAGDALAQVVVLDEGDVGAGVEGLVLGLVEVGDVHDLQRGVVAHSDRRGGIADGHAVVAGVNLLEVLRVDEDCEVVVCLGVYLRDVSGCTLEVERYD